MKTITTYFILALTAVLMVAGCVEEVKEVEKPDYNGMYCDCVLKAHDINTAELSFLVSIAHRQMDKFGTKNTILKDAQPTIDSFEKMHRAKLKECDSIMKLY